MQQLPDRDPEQTTLQNLLGNGKNETIVETATRTFCFIQSSEHVKEGNGDATAVTHPQTFHRWRRAPFPASHRHAFIIFLS
jgi:hypothetical protein